MNILLLSQWFDPEPTFKGLLFARKLTDMGHSVEVLTGFPNYPGGRLYDGYRVKRFQREVMDGIVVNRVPLYPNHDGSAVKRIANYASFALASAILGRLVLRKPDVIYVYHPPATIGLPAYLLSRLFRVPFVYDIQDLWPDTLAATGMLNNRHVLNLVDRWCHWIYRRAAKIVVLSPGFKKKLIQRGVASEKIEVIYNWCEENSIKPVVLDRKLSDQLGLTDRFNILFAGTMGKAQALDAVLDAAAVVEKAHPAIQFVFIGGGIAVEGLKTKAGAMGIGNVLFLNRRPYSEIGAILNMADVLLVHLKNDPLFEITIPSKTQANMAVGKPILMGVKGDAAELVKAANAGVACLPENAGEIAKAAVKLREMPPGQLKAMGENGKQFYSRELSLDVGAQKFIDVFSSLIDSSIS